MNRTDKARRNILAVEISRDELAFRIATGCVGLIPVAGGGAKEALDKIRGVNPGIVDGFYGAADAAVQYFHECVAAGCQPS